MNRIYNRISDTIGNTPVVRINKLGPANVNLFVKLESFNPLGSVKDRLALGVIDAAERSGALKPGQTVVEATSGNTGIGLAMLCAERGYPLVVTMAESFSVERRKLMRFLGARVVLTPASEKGSGMVAKAEELARQHGWFQSKQFENPANAEIHRRTTAVEIAEAFADRQLDYWVSGFGTGGTLLGVASALRQLSPKTRIVVCEPDNSAMLASAIPQPPGASHPQFRPHLMQGWTPDFISPLTEEAQRDGLIHELIAVPGTQALECAKRLAREEGILVGISSGASLAGALQLAERAAPGSNILCMLPDTGERYLSTVLFEDIIPDMNAEELAISQSTPGFRFDRSSAPVAPVALEPEVQARAEFEALLADSQQPVVLFGLEWCEFCWSVRKLLDRLEIPFRPVDLDSVAYQVDGRGAQLRELVRRHTGINTLPQIFIGGQYAGGCIDMFEKFTGGQLAEELQGVGISLHQEPDFDPYSLLPGWLHPR